MGVDVSSRVWKHSKQDESALVVLLALADWADDDGLSWYNIEKIASRARKQVRQTQNLIKRLEQSGELYRQVGRGRGKTSTYAVLTGLTADEIADVLIRRFDKSPQEAQSIASDLAQKNNLQKQEKVQSSTPLKKVQRTAPKEIKGAIQRQEKVQSGENFTGARAYDPSLDPSNTEIPPAQSAEVKPPSNDSIIKPDDFVVVRETETVIAPSYAAATKEAAKGGTITQAQALTDTQREKNKQGLLFQAWVDEVGRDTLPAGFAFKPYMNFMKKLSDDGYEPPDLTCAASLFKAWLTSHKGKVPVTWKVGAVVEQVRAAIELCKSGICSEDVTTFVKARYAETDSNGNRFWSGKLVSFEHVAKFIGIWKAERTPSPDDGTGERWEVVEKELEPGVFKRTLERAS